MRPSEVVAILAAALPPWLHFPVVGRDAILGFAAPKGTVWAKSALDVTITAEAGTGWMAETKPVRLPRWCPELHLNADRTFCLGLDPQGVTDKLSARQWWADVEVHLRLLSVALKTRAWPLHSGLDHGDAGRYQREARRLAQRLGLAEDYARAEAGESSWISDSNYAIISLGGARLSTERSCPCGCRTSAGRSYSLGRCPRRRQVAQLILLERARRLELSRFWAEAALRGAQCCGKIRGCPLADGSPMPPKAVALKQTRAVLEGSHRL